MSIELRAAVILAVIGTVTALTLVWDEIENRRMTQPKRFDCTFCGDTKQVRVRGTHDYVPCPYCEGW